MSETKVTFSATEAMLQGFYLGLWYATAFWMVYLW